MLGLRLDVGYTTSCLFIVPQAHYAAVLISLKWQLATA